MRNSFDFSHTVFEFKNSLYTIGTFQENEENSLGIADGIPDTVHTMLMSFSLNGAVNYRNFYTPNSCSSGNSYYTVLGNNLIATGTTMSPKNYCGSYLIEDPPPGIDEEVKYRIFVTKTDLVSANKKQVVYRTGKSSYPFSLNKISENEILIGNFVEQDGSIRLLKINADLDSLSCQTLLDSVPLNYSPIYLDKTSADYLLLLTSQLDNASHFELFSSDGTKISHTNFPFVILSISKTADNGYIAIKKETSVNTNLIKFDSHLNIEWTTAYNVYANLFVKQTKDGNYIIGNKTFAKVNKDSVIWSHRYFGDNNITPWYFVFDATETSDGGYALTGFYEANTLLIKTDCAGNLFWDAGCPNLSNDTVKAITAFPNPFKDEVTFQLTDFPAPSYIRLVNMLGQVIFDQTVTDSIFKTNTTSLASGVYVYYIYDGKKIHKTGKIVKI